MHSLRHFIICLAVFATAPTVSASCIPKDLWLKLAPAKEEFSLSHKNYLSISSGTVKLDNHEKILASLIGMSSIHVAEQINTIGMLISIHQKLKTAEDRAYVYEFLSASTRNTLLHIDSAISGMNDRLANIEPRALVLQGMALRDSMSKVRSILASCSGQNG